MVEWWTKLSVARVDRCVDKAAVSAIDPSKTNLKLGHIT